MNKIPPILLALAFAASGCTPLTPRLDSQFGNSVRAAAALQTRAPDLAARQDAIAAHGVDGRAGVAAYARYQDSFVAPAAPAPALTIGLGKR